MLVESPLLKHPSEFGKPNPTLAFLENERFIEEWLLSEWMKNYIMRRHREGKLDTRHDCYLPFVRDPWEEAEVADHVRHAIAGRTIRVNPSHEPGALFVQRGANDEFYIFEVVGEAVNNDGRPVFVEAMQKLIL